MFLHIFDTPHQGLSHPSSYLSTSSLPYSSHHAPTCGSHVLACASHVLSHSPRSSSANLILLNPLLQPLLSGLFSCLLFLFFIKYYFPCIVIFLVFCSSCCYCLLLVFVSCSLLGLRCFDHFLETSVIRFVVVSLFLAVPISYYDNAFSASISLRWLSLVLYGSSDKLALICSLFAFVTALCGPSREPSHLFVLFLILCNYFWAVLVYFYIYC